MEKVSAFVITLNEENNLPDCLRSLSFCDEIVVVDSGSTDKTTEIAESFGARVIYNKFEGYVEQKSFALEQTTNNWCINIDADERVDDVLREEIISVLSSSDKQKTQCYNVNRVVYFLGRWWRSGGWYPEYRLRFFKKGAVKWGGRNPHEKAIPLQPQGRLTGELQHFTYANLQEQVLTLVKFARLAAEQDFAQGKAFSRRKLVFSPLARFFKFFLLKRGYNEGIAGFVVALNEMFYSFLKVAFLWERHRDRSTTSR